MIRKIAAISCASLLGSALFFSAPPAHAGFEWTPASAKQKVMAPPMASRDIAPRITPMAAQAPQANAASVEDVQIDVLSDGSSQGNADDSEAVATVTAVGEVIEPPAPPKSYKVVEGFGKNVPLAYAMSQIVPAGYAYSFEGNPQMAGAMVSWTGGSPWNLVLKNAVAPLGYEASIVDHTVWIRKPAPQPVMEESITMMPAPVAVQAPAMAAVSPAPMPVAATPAQPAHPMAQPHAKASPMAPTQSLKDVNSGSVNEKYPRRNPIPMMMKSDGQDSQAAQSASNMPQTLAVPRSPMDAVPMQQQANTNYAEPIQAAGAAVPQARNNEQQALPLVTPKPVGQTAKADKPSHDMSDIQFWQAKGGDSLRNVLTAWGGKSAVRIYWSAPYDYRIPGDVSLHGSFADAVSALLKQYDNLEPRPIGRLHPNKPNGPAVLIIENYSTKTAQAVQ